MASITKPPALPKPPLQRWQQVATKSKNKEGPLTARAPCKTPKSDQSVSQIATKTPKSGKKTPATTPAACRFIPSRGHESYSSHMLLAKDKAQRKDDDDDEENTDPCDGDENSIYRTALLVTACNGEPPRDILTFGHATPISKFPANYMYATSGGNPSLTKCLVQGSQKKAQRKVPATADKILDAPEILDDYYLNVLDWSRTNIMAVALGAIVYLWNATTETVSQLLELPGEGSYVSSLSWAQKGKYLAIGVDNGDIQLWDVPKEKKVRTMSGHSDRVGSLHWNEHTLASGSRSGAIHIHDVRQPQHCVHQISHHTMEVCGLKWSHDGGMLASGSNDNTVCIWNMRTRDTAPLQILAGHIAAVKALAWCPWQSNLLASGGGSNDKTLRLWNVTSGECQRVVNTKSQVSSIEWSKTNKELISAHGHPHNQLIIWKYPAMTKVQELKGHEGRVLHMTISPHRTRVMSAGADETLRIWRCFDPPTSKDESVHSTSLSSSFLHGGRV